MFVYYIITHMLSFCKDGAVSRQVEQIEHLDELLIRRILEVGSNCPKRNEDRNNLNQVPDIDNKVDFSSLHPE